MFSEQLSKAVLRLCETEHLTYEAASELCDISARFFGSIARGKVSPSIDTLEKLCRGLRKEPNELLGMTMTEEELSYRAAMNVVQYERFECGMICPICPRCETCLDREYQSYCDNCGQKLNWDRFDKATRVERGKPGCNGQAV